jgi:hypothetical protein
MSKLVLAFIAFLLVFAGVFLVTGWYILPKLPPMPQIPDKMSNPQFWANNWASLLAGFVVAVLAAFSILKMKPKKAKSK